MNKKTNSSTSLKGILIFSLILLITMIFGSCSPTLDLKIVQRPNSLTPIEYYQGFIISESDTFKLENAQYIGELRVKNNAFLYNCDYQSIKRLAEKQARQWGANCLIITEHKKPDLTGTCHRLTAKMYFLDNVAKFENTIIWHPNRPLKISDFKSSTVKRPAQAATSTGIEYQIFPDLVMGRNAKLLIKSIFNCNLSYFKRSLRDSMVLAHEQIHFDITELYARKFRKRVLDEANSYKLFMENYDLIFADIREQWVLKNDEYDSEVYEDRSKQDGWEVWVETELEKYSKYDWIETMLPFK